MTTASDGSYQVAQAEREGPGRRGGGRGERTEYDGRGGIRIKPFDPVQETIWQKVAENVIPQGYQVDANGYRYISSTERTGTRQPIRTNGGEYVVLRKPLTDRVFLVVAEQGRPGAIVVPILDGVSNPDAVAERALEYRRVAQEYFSRTGISETRQQPPFMTEGEYMRTTQQEIQRRVTEIRSIESSAPGARPLKPRADNGGGFEHVSYTPGAGEASPFGAIASASGLTVSDVSMTHALTAAPNVPVMAASGQAPTRRQPPLTA